MLNEPTLTKLCEMKLNGMAEAYEEQRASSTIMDLSFEERFAMLVERQWLWKENPERRPPRADSDQQKNILA